jgi:hypothetical protein
MTLDEYDTIHSLRSIEPIAHEREDWRAAVIAAAAGSAMSMEPADPQKLLRLIQCEEEEVTTVPPEQASRVAQGGHGGDVRRPGSPTRPG